MAVMAALGEMPAEEGIGAVLGAALNGVIALALIFIVLVIMNKVRDKKEADGNDGKGENSGESGDDGEKGTNGKGSESDFAGEGDDNNGKGEQVQ